MKTSQERSKTLKNNKIQIKVIKTQKIVTIPPLFYKIFLEHTSDLHDCYETFQDIQKILKTIKTNKNNENQSTKVKNTEKQQNSNYGNQNSKNSKHFPSVLQNLPRTYLRPSRLL